MGSTSGNPVNADQPASPASQPVEAIVFSPPPPPPPVPMTARYVCVKVYMQIVRVCA